MVDYQRKLLEELMGPLEPAGLGKKWWDHDVCKFYMINFCPNELFTNTKSDLGPCRLIHDDKLKAAFQTAPEEERQKYLYQWTQKFYFHLDGLILDLDRRIAKGNNRLAMEVHENDVSGSKEEKEQKIESLQKELAVILQKVEQCAEEGQISEAATLNSTAETLQSELDSLLSSIKPSAQEETIMRQEKRLNVCEICGSFLVVGDTSQRLELHMEGKQHIGYKLIRDAHSELQQSHPEWARRSSSSSIARSQSFMSSQSSQNSQFSASYPNHQGFQRPYRGRGRGWGNGGPGGWRGGRGMGWRGGRGGRGGWDREREWGHERERHHRELERDGERKGDKEHRERSREHSSERDRSRDRRKRDKDTKRKRRKRDRDSDDDYSRSRSRSRSRSARSRSRSRDRKDRRRERDRDGKDRDRNRK
ncbi:hypothetical protein BKA69DRAFT_682503 [Paraphysoderma sedebokerense]|nr:hypothetical protein BKA69DRAFT_682503 [Paraphysoderma sedebokerense]